METCYLNGKIVPKSEAVISIFDIGLLRGMGIYEAMAAWNGEIFRFAEHMHRFRTSAAGLHIDIPASDTEIESAIFQILGANFPRSNIKFILTGGTTIGGIDYDPSMPTFAIFAEAWKPLPPEYYEKGIKIITHEHVRHFAEYKTTDYMTAVQLQMPMKKAGATEALYTKDGFVFECTTSNFFIVEGGTLVTPKDDILQGITRKALIEYAQKAGIKVEERKVTLREALAADECFITSSFKDILPVREIDAQVIADGSVGPVTKNLIRIFAQEAGLAISAPSMDVPASVLV